MAHLDDRAALRWQTGESTEAERAHVAACPQCQAEVLPLAGTLQQFGMAARQWGERKAAHAPQLHAARARRRVGWEALMAVAALLLFAVVMTATRWHTRQSTHQDTFQAAAVQQQQRQQQLAQDDALLEAVDQDVSQAVPDALTPLSVSTSTIASSQSQQ